MTALDQSDATDRDLFFARGVGRLVVVGALVGWAWLGVHGLFAAIYPDQSVAGPVYRYRDDALITLSHARGLHDVGTVSVGVSGSRVEGYSAPVQFAFASAFYGLGGDGYRGFLDGQVVVSTMLLGLSVFVLLRVAAPRRAPTTTAIVSIALAVPLFATFAFFGWHSSGMENSITNALAAASVAALAVSLRRPSLLPIAGVVVGLFALSRVEFAFHALPLLVVAAAVLFVRTPGRERWLRVGQLVVPALAVWATVNLARVWYFGDLFPNTAEAQGISPFENLRMWAEVLWPLVVPFGLGLYLLLRKRATSIGALVRHTEFTVATVVAAGMSALLAWRAYGDDHLPGFDTWTQSAKTLGVWWWLALILGLALLVRPRLGVVDVLLVTLVGTGACYLLVFGPARLASERVVTFVLVPLACLVGSFALRVADPRDLLGSSRTMTDLTRVAMALALLLIAFGGAILTHRTWAVRQGLCCDVSATVGQVLGQVSALEQATGGLPGVSVAIPDLGLISFEKKVNITDLGGLGDPLLARVWRRGEESGRTDVAVDYLNHYAAPDVVELHGVWSCKYAPWWSSPDFQANYRQVSDDAWTESWGVQGCPQVMGLVGGIWVRADLDAAGPEVVLSRTLARRPDPAIVRRELSRCASAVPWSCEYVTRGVYRNLRAFEDAGKLDETLRAFRQSPSPEYDRALLSSRDHGDWYVDAVRGLFERGGAAGARR